MVRGRMQSVTLVSNPPNAKLKAGYKISFLLRVPEPLKKALGTDRQVPVILTLGQRGEMKSSQPLWRKEVGINASGRKTIHLIARERFQLITRKKGYYFSLFFFLLFRFGDYYLSVLTFTDSILTSPLYNLAHPVIFIFGYCRFQFSIFHLVLP